MKKLFLNLLFLMVLSTVSQAQKWSNLDKSPMDRSYYPTNFAHDRKFAPEKVGDKAFIQVTYSRPAKKERDVFGKLIPFDKVWRAGANESTEIKFYQDVMINGKKVNAGMYSLFCIPNEKEWVIILNSDVDYWGAYSYNESKDVMRVTVPVKKSESIIENFSIQFEKASDKSALMQLGWDTTFVELTINF